MNDDRIARYLADQAEGITLPPADPDGVMRRGSRRRTRKRAALVGSVAVVAVLATSVALRDDGSDQHVEVNYSSPQVQRSAYDWSTVSPDSGLAWSSSSVELGGSIYSLSTAPASSDRSQVTDADLRPTLYRSDDGAEWSQATGPDGLRLSSLAAAGDTLYALGTAPAGGDTRDVVVAASTDGAETWTNVTLPRDVADIESRHPGQVMVGQPRIVARDATHLVASIGVSANLDPAQYFPDMNTGDRMYTSEWTDTGLVIRDQGAMQGCIADSPTPEGEPANMTCAAEARGMRTDEDAGEVVFDKSYAELGIDAELQDLIDGRSLTYVSDDGRTFERVDVPETDSDWTADLIAAPDGYRMARGSYGGTSEPVATLLRSADGHTWTVDTTLPGSPGELGLLGDRVVVSIFDETGNHVSVQQADGQWVDLNLTGAITVGDDEQAWIGDIAFGPLGLATIVSTADKDGSNGDSYLIHSVDGTSLSVLPVADLVSEPVSPVGLTVTADAIAARFTVSRDGDPSTPVRQVVLVGTPTG